MDEFNTKLQFSTPIISFKKKLSIISRLIGSGFAIELTRRKKDSKEDTWKYDEDNFIIAVKNDGTGWKPEKDEAFISPVTGIDSPSTAYNLRLSPKRMLLAWSKWINSCLVFKKGFDVLKNTFSSKNGDLTTQFKDTETCAIGDSDKTLVQENADIALSDMDLFEKTFTPDRIYFNAPLTWQQILLIKRCHQNQDNDGKNYGYIRVRDNDGVYQKGYLISLKYNPTTETCTFVLKKKYQPGDSDFNCADYANWTFGDFEVASGLSTDIEQCKFENFD